MPFILSRILALALLCCIVVVITNRSLKPKTKRRVITVLSLIVVVILTVAGIVPNEASLGSFPTAEQAYNHAYPGTVRLVVEGNNTALVIAEEGANAFNHRIVVRGTDDTWNATSGNNSSSDTFFVEDTIGTIYTHKETNECYIEVQNISGYITAVSDSRGSVFQKLPVTKDIGFDSYYAYVGDLEQNYEIIINGEHYAIFDE